MKAPARQMRTLNRHLQTEHDLVILDSLISPERPIGINSTTLRPVTLVERRDQPLINILCAIRSHHSTMRQTLPDVLELDVHPHLRERRKSLDHRHKRDRL